jgi:predicted MPP superfamily phosphohydrolase
MASHGRHVFSNSLEMISELSLMMAKIISLLLDTDFDNVEKKEFFESIAMKLERVIFRLDKILGDFTEDELREKSKVLIKKLGKLKDKFIMLDQMDVSDYESYNIDFNYLVEETSSILEFLSDFSGSLRRTVDTFSDRFNRDNDPNFGFN